MSYRSYNFILSISVIALVGFVSELTAQRVQPRQGQVKQAVQVSLKVGGQTYQSSEPGKCTHAPIASMYQIVSEMWSVQQSVQGGSLALSFWRPKDGSSDMITLSVRNGNTSHQVSTVRGGGSTSGSGKITFEKSGAGGTFTVAAKTEKGDAITGTIKCDAFAPHTAEGGL